MKDEITKALRHQMVFNRLMAAHTSLGQQARLNPILDKIDSYVALAETGDRKALPSKEVICPKEEYGKIDWGRIKELRDSMRLNQRDFWFLFGMTQSTGSRYENGRAVPMPVRMLITLFVNNVVSKKLLDAAFVNSLDKLEP